MMKLSRHVTIKEIIAARSIGTQEDLRRELRKRGFRVTQATLSRDLRELGVIRLTSGTKSQYTLSASGGTSALRPIVGAEIAGIEANESLVIIHTLPGAAHTVGEYIDLLKEQDIIGTVAGDNTLLVIPASVSKTRHVMNHLRHILLEGAP